MWEVRLIKKYEGKIWIIHVNFFLKKVYFLKKKFFSFLN